MRRWEVLRDRFTENITDFTFPPGHVLPSMKELCHQYGTCYRVLSRALQALVESEKLERYRSGFRVCRIRTATTANTIVLFQVFDEPAGIEHFLPNVEECWRSLERECTRLGIHLHVHLLPMMVSGEMVHVSVTRVVQDIEQKCTVAGYVISTICCPPDPFRSLLQAIGSLGKPAAVLEGNHIDLNDVWSSFPHARVFRLGTGMLAGESVGRYLLELGHRDIAYLSPRPAEHVGDRRLDGLRKAYTGNGLTGGVHRYYVSSATGSETDAIHSAHGKTFRYGVMKKASEFIRHYGASEMKQHSVSRSVKLLIRTGLRSVLYHDVFTEALSREGITAWVTYNDSVAFGALEFLEEHGVSVPGRLSLVGFDNTGEALARGLTSYDFNIPAIMHAVVEHILAPTARRRQKHVVVEIPGRVMERDSTGGVGRRA